MNERLDKLKRMLRARCDGKGKALPGYAGNIEEIKKAIAELEAEIAAEPETKNTEGD